MSVWRLTVKIEIINESVINNINFQISLSDLLNIFVKSKVNYLNIGAKSQVIENYRSLITGKYEKQIVFST